MRVAGVLFDFDHTLVDSPIDFAAMRQGVYDILDEQRLQVADRDHKLTLEVVEEAAAALAPVAGDELRRRCGEHILSIEVAAAREAQEVPGVAAALVRLREQQRAVGIITRNCRAVIETVLAKVPLEYDVLLCRDDVAQVKPAPEHAWAALDAMRVPRAEALLVGDFRGDVECALRAGLLPVGVLTGHADEAALREAGAAHVLPSAAVLPEWLQAMGW